MRRFSWTVYVVTDDGKVTPHWTDYSRERARKVAKQVREAIETFTWENDRRRVFVRGHDILRPGVQLR